MCLPIITEPLAGLFHCNDPSLYAKIAQGVYSCAHSKEASDSSSYCAIALAPNLSRVLEWCLLLQFTDSLAISIICPLPSALVL